MTAFLPPNLLALFAPRDPIPYLSPLDKPSWLKRPWPYHGIAPYVREFEDPSETPPPTRGETRDEKTKRKRKEKIERNTKLIEEQLEQWDPHNDANAVGTDAFKTLFIGRINYDTSESKLRREMELYGPIKRIHIVHNVNTDKPRGYAFIEYEHERDMHGMYAKKIIPLFSSLSVFIDS